MNKLKPLAVLTIVLLLTAALITGCAKAENEHSQATVPPDSTAAESEKQTVLFLLPEDTESVNAYLPFLQKLYRIQKHGVLLLVNSKLENLLQTNQIKQEVLYYSTLGCRYGEQEFQKIEEVLKARQITATFDLQDQTLFQMLYLCKTCGATYRFGFDCESLYPLLNLSLVSGGEVSKRIEALTAIFEGAVK